jgi:TRAP-type C4-dicarboxylate transport system permease small subunit
MNHIFRIIDYVGAVCVGVLGLMTCGNVLGRYLFNAPLQGSVDYTENVLVVIVAFGLAATTAAGEHISVDVLFTKFSSAWQHILNAVTVFISFVIFSALAWRGLVAGLESITTHETMMTMVNTPIYPFRLILAIGFISCVVALLRQMIQLFRSKTGDSPES